MPKFCYVLIALIAVVLSSCSNDSAPTDANNNGNGGGIGSHEFAIVSVDEDSVYWDDRIVIALQNAKANPLRVFIHTVVLSIDSQWIDGAGKTKLRVVIPQSASTGKLRVYDSSDSLAKGDFLIEVFEARKKDFASLVYAYRLEEGYPGDALLLKGYDIPLRRSDIEVKIGDVIVPVESTDSASISARLPMNVKTGPLTVRLFDKIFPLTDTYRILTHTGEFLSEGRLKTIRIEISKIAGLGSRVFVEEDQSLVFGDLLADDFSFDFPRQAANTSQKDLIIIDSQETEIDFLKMEVRLRRETESRVSGIIRFSTKRKDGSYETGTELEIEGMRWRKVGNQYKILAYASDVAEHLKRYMYYWNIPTVHETHSYEKPLQEAVVSITLTP